MRVWGLGAVVLLAVLTASCGGNSTPVGVTVVGTGLSPMTIVVNTSVQFAANVTGSGASTVFWEICEPASTPPSTMIPPTDCTVGQGPAGCTITPVMNPLTGFGTITANGRYTAPATAPQPNNFLIVATSCVDAKAFGFFTVIIDSGIRVRVSPPNATLGTGEKFQFAATVSGTADTSVVWAVGGVPGGNSTLGFICPSASAPPGTCGPGAGSPGEYFAPSGPQGVTVAAQSGADPNQQGTAAVTVVGATTPTIASIDPTIAVEGSVQQDVYLTGTGFLSTSNIFVGGVLLPESSVTFLGPTLLRLTVPAAQLTQAAGVPITVQPQGGGPIGGPVSLTVVAARPALIASSPDSVTQNNGNASLNVLLTGGYFTPATTTATFNGIGCGGGNPVCTGFVDSRHLNVTIASGALSTPGLYPLIVQNSDAASALAPSMSGLNLAVTPAAGSASISGAPTATVSVGGPGSNPSAVAIDEADGIAVVADAGTNQIALVDLASKAVVKISVGNNPTGVAVDDRLTDPVALVVNSADQTVSTVDLKTQSVVGTPLPVSIGPLAASPVPLSIGINSITHRAIVAYQSTNEATILDLSSGVASVVEQIGGSLTSYSTGPKPAVAIDSQLNWALVTPGGAGTTNLVDLGRAASAVDVGRLPQVIGSLSISPSVQGIGIDAESHRALLTNPLGTTLTEFSLLDNTVTSVTFTNNGQALNQSNYVAAAVNPLENVGIAVNGASSNATAVVVDLTSGVVLQNVNGLGSQPQAVAVDPASNQAVIANGIDGTVSFLSLGPALISPQIIDASPGFTLGGTGAADLPLTITGAAFVTGANGSKVLLDGTALPAANVNVVSPRRIVATVPGAMLESARRYLVQVQNTGGSASNISSFAAVVPVPVGSSPVGVAVDTDRDLAVVTNSFDDTASLVSLSPNLASLSPESLGPVGPIGLPIAVGTTPEGVAVIPRLGLAVVANTGSDDATSIDVTTSVPTPFKLCGTNCSGPTGVAIDSDTATAAITNTNQAIVGSTGSVSLFGLPVAANITESGFATVDQDPVAVAVDPALNLAAVATASSTSSVELINMGTTGAQGRVANGLQNPSGVVFDPVNQVFVAANSLENNIVVIDPTTLIQSSARVGIAPTSLDYNFQTSTLVTVNSASHTMSVLDYVCPPSSGASACTAPHVRTVLGLGGAQTSTLILGPNAVAVDPKLNLAVLVDPDNNRVLLVPLPF
ncbi:MAG TPA: hypothetical protein VJO53_05005 [Candidatus Acidoferrales bacterium]|nr:hypothetical protein [Candidatus Acidoferrales bacterium]